MLDMLSLVKSNIFSLRKSKFNRTKNRCTYMHVPTYTSGKEKREESALLQILTELFI
jgi:hypothetical protein